MARGHEQYLRIGSSVLQQCRGRCNMLEMSPAMADGRVCRRQSEGGSSSEDSGLSALYYVYRKSRHGSSRRCFSREPDASALCYNWHNCRALSGINSHRFTIHFTILTNHIRAFQFT